MAPVEKKAEYRAIGERLYKYTSSLGPGINKTSAAQSALADLLGEHINLLLPLKDLVSRARFISFQAGGKDSENTLLRDGLLDELKRYYNDDVLGDIMEVINGYFGLESDREFGKVRDTKGTQPGSETDKNQNESTKESQEGAHQSENIQKSSGIANGKPKRKQERNRISLEKVVLVVALVAGSTTLAWKVSIPCRLMGYCPEYMATVESKENIRRANELLGTVDRADGVDALADIVKNLGALIKETSKMPLTESQSEQLRKATERYEELNTRVKSEKDNAFLIKSASTQVEAAEAEEGEAKKKHLANAKEIFDKINLVDRSFLIGEYKRLKLAIREGGKPKEQEEKKQAESAGSSNSVQGGRKKNQGSGQTQQWKNPPPVPTPKKEKCKRLDECGKPGF